MDVHLHSDHVSCRGRLADHRRARCRTPSSYAYASNIRYTLQRATGIIAFVFIVFHVIQLHHFFGAPFKEIGDTKFGAQFDPAHAASSAAVALQPLWIKWLYLVGMLSAIYHFANGLWTQGITWGIWTSAAAQRRASWVSVFVGLLLTVVGLTALAGFSFVDVEQAEKVEDAMEAQQAADPPDSSSRANRRPSAKLPSTSRTASLPRCHAIRTPTHFRKRACSRWQSNV